MKSSRAFAGFLIWATLFGHAFGCGINIINRCPYSVTTCAQANRAPGQTKTRMQQFNLGAGQSQFLDFGSGCNWNNGAIWPSPRGQCESSTVPNEANDWDVTDYAEFNMNQNGLDYYDVSNVSLESAAKMGVSDQSWIQDPPRGGIIGVMDSFRREERTIMEKIKSHGLMKEKRMNVAFTLSMRIRPTNPANTPNGRSCGSPQCIINNIPSFCQGNNKLITWPTGAYTCQNTDGLAERGPTDGTRVFKNACPDAYSYNKDDDTSVYACPTGTNYEVIWCP